MPERPKRRKNNKNKRKNKNLRFDGNKNDNDVKVTGDYAESCSEQQLGSTETKNSITTIDESTTENNITSLPSVSNQNYESVIEDSVVCFATENTSQDLNNNIDFVEQLEVPSSSTLDKHESNQECEAYVVESPEQSLKPKCKKRKAKLESVKSKSLDNDDAPQIVEITESNTEAENDSSVSIIDSSNVVVCEADIDVEWEKAKELNPENTADIKEVATGTLSITTIPLNVAQCEQTKSLTPEEEMSLRHYLQTLNLSTSPNVNSVEIKTEIEQIINREIKHRLRKKGLADDIFVQRLGPPRMLDVIDEESSESSMTSRRQSYLSDKKSDNDDLEDDVFEDKTKPTEKYFTKSVSHLSNKSYERLIPQQCMLVGTQLKEPGVTEARGDWTMQTVEKMTGAEVVYLTDSSSSTSSIHEICDETDDSAETDVSVRMITPTIEVTDTEDLLKRTFVEKIKCSDTDKISGIHVNNNVEIKDNNCDNLYQNNPTSEYCENPHEIVVLSTDDIKTKLYVKDLDETVKKSNINEESKLPDDQSLKDAGKKINPENDTNIYDLQMKVLKCELNDAINNLIKEVSSDSDVPNENVKNNFTRQDSSSSVCSSQCTAKYNPTSSSLNDVSNILHDETFQKSENSNDSVRIDSKTHVKDVFECVTGTTSKTISQHRTIDQPLTLRDLCVKKITKLPYGLKILEELASVSERLQHINVYGLKTKENETLNSKSNFNKDKMPYYPPPDLSSIEKVSLPSKGQETFPPPVLPRNSSLKKSQDDNHWTALPSKSDPVYVCFSPSQKMLMEKTNTVITKEDASELIDIHKKFVDRRGYNEYYKEKKTGSEYVKEPPVVPFKSQTGSRLLALIRDPTVTYNINSSVADVRKHHSYANLENSYNTYYNRHQSDKRDLLSTFKPIPPPRPKKYSSSYYESDESSDFTDSSFRSMKSERKYFHYSTGNLSKEIENDVSSIQNMHRHFTDIRDSFNEPTNLPRRPSLPKDICDKQMEYIRQKEKEVEAEIKRLEQEKSNKPAVPARGPKAPLIKDKDNVVEQNVENDYRMNSKSTSNDIQPPEKQARSRLKSLFSSSEEELLRDKMYSEYVNQMAERQERKQHRIIKITNTGGVTNAKSVSKSMSALDILDSKVNNRIEKEFISKARERWDKLGIKDPETEDEKESSKDVYREPKVIEHKIKVIEGNKETDVKKLPSHLQDFVRFTAKDKDDGRSSSGEFGSKPASPHVVVWCAVIIIVFAIGRYFLRLLRNK